MAENAVLIKVSKGVKERQTAAVYKLSKEVKFGDDERTVFVWVSALREAFDTGRPETYIFPCDKDGVVLSWGELEGSYRGGTDHKRALSRLGFKVTEGE